MPKNTKGLKPFTKDDNRASEAGKKSTHGISLKKALIDLLQNEIDTNGVLTPNNVVRAMVVKGIKGNGAMMKLVVECVDGKPTENINLKSESTEEIEIKFV